MAEERRGRGEARLAEP